MTNMEWYGSNLIRRHQRRFRPFFCEKPLVKNTFQILSQKNAQIVNLKNPDLDLIRRIHPECGFYEFMIRFWICPKTLKIRFLDSEIRIWIFPKKRTLTSMSLLMESVRKVIADCVEYLRPWRQNQHWYLGNRSREPVTSSFLPIRRSYWINSI